MIHEAIAPGQWWPALRRLPPVVLESLARRVQEWALTGLADYLKTQAPQFISATDAPVDGATLVITVANAPGLPQLRQALKTGRVSAGDLKFVDGTPNVSVRVAPGHAHE